MRIVVVGGGIVGLSCAWALRRVGCEVTVLDARAPGQGASRVNAGWITPALSDPTPAPGVVGASLRGMSRPESPLYIQPRPDPALARWLLAFWRRCNVRDFTAGLDANLRLNQRTMQLYDTLEADGVRFESHRAGLLCAYIAPLALEHDLRSMARLADYGIVVPEPVWGADLHALEPALSDAVNGGFVFTQERHVRPVTVTAGLVEWLAERNVAVEPDSPVTGFAASAETGRVEAVLCGRKRFAADVVVLAAGSWTGRLTALLSAPIPLQGGKGYCLDYLPPPVHVSRAVYLHEARIAITPMDDRLRLSGTMEFSGLNETIRPKRVAAIARGAAMGLAGWTPDPAAAQLGAGLRPMSPDGLPLIGWLPGWRNAAVATGHGMLGMTQAPATAEALATLITTGVAPDVLTPFAPKRFARH